MAANNYCNMIGKDSGELDSRARRVYLFETVVQPGLAEFFGTMMFVIVGSLSVTSGSPVGPALGFGISIAYLIMSIGKISGGSFNPAVSVALVWSRQLSPAMGLVHLIAQLLGATAGAASVYAALPSSVYAAISGGSVAPNPQMKEMQIFYVEMLLTMVLVFVVLCVAVDEKYSLGNGVGGLAIGLTIVVLILASANLSGGGMNPARVFGPALIANKWEYHYMYWLGPLAGSMCATLLYQILLAATPRRIIFKHEDNSSDFGSPE